MKYALIGCGRISPNHIEAAKNNGLEFVAMCDVLPQAMAEKAERFALENVRRYTDYRELLEKEQPELVAIATESGGLQCEAFYAGVQCVFVLDYVVWPETMVDNRNQLAKADHADILEKLSKHQRVDPAYTPFGDGHAAEKICQIITKWGRNEL